MARRSLRDRNAAALAHEFYEPVDAPAEEAPAEPPAEPVNEVTPARATPERCLLYTSDAADE